LTNFPIVFPDTGDPITFAQGWQYTFDITMTAANGIKVLTMKPTVTPWSQYEDNTGDVEPIPVPTKPSSLIGQAWPIGSSGTDIQGVITGVADDQTTVTEILYFIKEEMVISPNITHSFSIRNIVKHILTRNTLTQPNNATWVAQDWSAAPTPEFISTYLAPLYSEATRRGLLTAEEASAQSATGDIYHMYVLWPEQNDINSFSGKVGTFNIEGTKTNDEMVNFYTITAAAPYNFADELFYNIFPAFAVAHQNGKGEILYAGDFIGASTILTSETNSDDAIRRSKMSGAVIPLKAKTGTVYNIGDYYPNPGSRSSSYVWSIDKDGKALSILSIKELVSPTQADGIVLSGTGSWTDKNEKPTDATIGLNISAVLDAFTSKNSYLHLYQRAIGGWSYYEYYNHYILNILGKGIADLEPYKDLPIYPQLGNFYNYDLQITHLTAKMDFVGSTPDYVFFDYLIRTGTESFLKGDKSWTALGNNTLVNFFGSAGSSFALKSHEQKGDMALIRVSLKTDQSTQSYSWTIDLANIPTEDWGYIDGEGKPVPFYGIDFTVL
jgi:hypothetical protein